MTNEATVIKYKGGEAYNPVYSGKQILISFYNYDLLDEFF